MRRRVGSCPVCVRVPLFQQTEQYGVLPKVLAAFYNSLKQVDARDQQVLNNKANLTGLTSAIT